MTKRKDDTTPEPASPTIPAAWPPADRPKPNIKFIGRRVFDAGKRKVLSDPQPLERISFAGRLVNLPAAGWQKRNRLFYHKAAAEIIAAFPHLYKKVRSK
jgi:hypothetical protein